MKAVLTALEGMGKASCREIAARLKKDVREMMDILQNMEDRKEVTFVNGYWSIAGAAPMKSDITPVPRAAAPKTKSLPPVKERRNFREDILLILRTAATPMFTSTIAEAMGRVPNALNGTLAKMADKGLITKHVDGRNITWTAAGIPAAAPKAEPKPAACQAAKSTSDIVADIPTFTARANDLILPTSAAISSRLRRARAEVASLEELQVAVRTIRRRHGKLLRELAQ